jgi:hypothetical protein
MFEDSKTQLFVCTATNGNAAWTALPNGSGGFYHYPQGALNEDAIAAGETVYFVHKNTSGVYSFSPPFGLTNLKNALTVENEALVNQITYVGYNGVSGSLDAANSTYYSLRLVLDHTFGMLNNSPLMLTVPYKSDSSATQSEIASGLAVAATATLKRQAFKPLKVERINSGAQLVAHDNLSFVNGSKTFTSADNDTLTLLVGSILRVQEPESLGAATVTSPCYVIASHDSGAGNARIYTLDQEFQGVTNADNDQCETVTEGNWGLKLTGISVADAAFNPVTDEPFVSSFTVDLGENFETATVTYSTAPVIGTGTYQQVSALEAYCQFQNKTREVSTYPPTTRLFQAVSGETYHIHSFEIWNNAYVGATTGINPISPMRIVIAEDKDLTENFDTNLGTTIISTLI